MGSESVARALLGAAGLSGVLCIRCAPEENWWWGKLVVGRRIPSGCGQNQEGGTRGLSAAAAAAAASLLFTYHTHTHQIRWRIVACSRWMFFSFDNISAVPGAAPLAGRLHVRGCCGPFRLA